MVTVLALALSPQEVRRRSSVLTTTSSPTPATSAHCSAHALTLILQGAEVAALAGLTAWMDVHRPHSPCTVRTDFRVVYREAHVTLDAIDARYLIIAGLGAATLFETWAHLHSRWGREIKWCAHGITYLLVLWTTALRTNLVDVYGLSCLLGLVSASHALRLCVEILQRLALARMDTDGNPGTIDDDPCLTFWNSRLWVPVHLCAWTYTGVATLVLAVHHSLHASANLNSEAAAIHALVWGEIGLLCCICTVHTRALLLSSRIIESPQRFESVFCSAMQLRTGEMGVSGHIDDEDGGVILSLTRGERLRAACPLNPVLDAWLHWAMRSLLAWTLFGPLLAACSFSR